MQMQSILNDLGRTKDGYVSGVVYLMENVDRLYDENERLRNKVEQLTDENERFRKTVEQLNDDKEQLEAAVNDYKLGSDG